LITWNLLHGQCASDLSTHYFSPHRPGELLRDLEPYAQLQLFTMIIQASGIVCFDVSFISLYQASSSEQVLQSSQGLSKSSIFAPYLREDPYHSAPQNWPQYRCDLNTLHPINYHLLLKAVLVLVHHQSQFHWTKGIQI
jgi:hypothetical protein